MKGATDNPLPLGEGGLPKADRVRADPGLSDQHSPEHFGGRFRDR